MKPTRHLHAIEKDYDACRPRFVELVRQNRADLGRLAGIAQFAKLGELNTIAGPEFGHVYDSASLFRSIMAGDRPRPRLIWFARKNL
jgi:hypothetical protein